MPGSMVATAAKCGQCCFLMARPLFLYLFVVCGCLPSILTGQSQQAYTDAFAGREGCFYLLNIKTDEPLVFRESLAREAFPAGETIFLPLAMAAMKLDVTSTPDLQQPEAWLAGLDPDKTKAILEKWGFGAIEKKAGESWPERVFISAEQQAKFWARFVKDDFELNHAGSLQLFEQLLDKNEAGYLLLGLQATLPEKRGAWYVGMVQMQDNRLAFATWLAAGPDTSGEKARDITLQILQTLTRRQP